MKILSEKTARSPEDVQELFIRRWGDMGAVWGINRTTAEMQALLYITGATLHSEQIMERLGISRGGVSMAIRSLLDWGIVQRVRIRGDRRDYYQSLGDVWEIFNRVVKLRKQREIDPILETLRTCLDNRKSDHQSKGSGQSDEPASEVAVMVDDRLGKMVDFLTIMETLSRQIVENGDNLRQAVEMLMQINPDPPADNHHRSIQPQLP